LSKVKYHAGQVWIMTAEKIPAWIKQVLMPELSEIKGELKAINARIDATNGRIESTNERIDSLRTETKMEISSLRTELKMEISSLRTEMNVRLDSLEKRIPVIEKIAALEIKIADLEKRLVAA